MKTKLDSKLDIQRPTFTSISTALVAASILLLAASASQAGTLHFNGSSASVDVGAQPGLKLTNTSLTLEAWIKPTGRGSDATEGGAILGREGEYLLIRFADGTIRWAVATTTPGWAYQNTGITVPSNQWTHVALTYDGSNFTLYANGELRASTPGSGPVGDVDIGRNRFLIGAREGYGRYFQGQIDEVRLWSVARTPAEIAGSWNRRLAGTEPGLVAYYPMDEGTGTITADASGHGYTGTLLNGPLWNTAEDAVTPVAFTRPPTLVAGTSAQLNALINPNGAPTTNRFEWGAASTALDFDGVNDYFSVAGGVNLTGSSFTIEAWARHYPNSEGYDTILAQGPWEAHSGLFLGFAYNAYFAFGFTGDDLGTPVSYPDSDWHHWAGTYNASNRERKIYRDGIMVAKDTAGGTYAGTGTVLVGTGPSGFAGSYFNGNIDEVRI